MINLSSDCNSQYSVERSVFIVNENPKILIINLDVKPFNTVFYVQDIFVSEQDTRNDIWT